MKRILYASMIMLAFMRSPQPAPVCAPIFCGKISYASTTYFICSDGYHQTMPSGASYLNGNSDYLEVALQALASAVVAESAASCSTAAFKYGDCPAGTFEYADCPPRVADCMNGCKVCSEVAQGTVFCAKFVRQSNQLFYLCTNNIQPVTSLPAGASLISDENIDESQIFDVVAARAVAVQNGQYGCETAFLKVGDCPAGTYERVDCIPAHADGGTSTSGTYTYKCTF
ncbi:MAG: hypothetical protein LBB08_01440 [Rickettsiales bacterium]|nr:hypothetical protein [Rickettsiales bacterium]